MNGETRPMGEQISDEPAVFRHAQFRHVRDVMSEEEFAAHHRLQIAKHRRLDTGAVAFQPGRQVNGVESRSRQTKIGFSFAHQRFKLHQQHIIRDQIQFFVLCNGKQGLKAGWFVGIV